MNEFLPANSDSDSLEKCKQSRGDIDMWVSDLGRCFSTAA